MNASPSNSQHKRPNSPRLYKEVIKPLTEPTLEDIEEFARRLGIDPKEESHLLHLAREGLIEPLPTNWKPCQDPSRNAWYYYDTVTKQTQWEHPLDAIYRNKVIAARNMDRLKTSSEPTNNTLSLIKSLPPLKKGGGGNFLGQLLPVGSGTKETPEILGPPPGRLAPLAKSKSQTNLNLGSIPEPGKKISPPAWLDDEGDSGGDGSSAVSASVEKQSSEDTDFGRKILKPQKLTSILSKHPASHSHSNTSGVLRGLKLAPPPLLAKAEEKNFFSTGLAKLKQPIKARGNVRFNLEDDFEINFETSSRASIKSSEDGTMEDNTENDDEFDQFEEAVVQSRTVKGPLQPISISKKPNLSKSNNVPKTTTLQSTVLSATPPAEPAPKATTNIIADKSSILAKEEETLRLQMEVEVKAIRAKLQTEQKEEEAKLKKLLSNQLQEISSGNQTKVQSRKAELAASFEEELELAQRNHEIRLKEELDAFQSVSNQQIESRKIEIRQLNKELLAKIELEVAAIDKQKLLAEKTNDIMQSLELELSNRLKDERESLLAKQKSEIDALWVTHERHLEDLRREHQLKEEQIRDEHKISLRDLEESCHQEISELRAKFQQEKLATKNEETVTANQNSSILESHSLDDKERELAKTKIKYKNLQEKYSVLREEVSKAVSIEKARIHANNDDIEETYSALDESFADNSIGDSRLPPPSPKSVEPVPPNDRLSRALGALEVLRDQIMDMNQEAPNQPVAEEPIFRSAMRPATPRIIDSTRKSNSARTRKGGGKIVLTKGKELDPYRSGLRQEGDQLEIVREAKAFIKAQRYRLQESRPQPEALRHSLKDFLQSETTESSGFVSIRKSPRTPRYKSHVANDIDGILVSLRKLDAQMQSLWTMVTESGDSIGPRGFLAPLVHPTSPAALAQFNVMRENGGLDSLQTGSCHPLITNADLRTRYNVAPLQASHDFLTAVPTASILNNLSFNQPSKDSFDEELQAFEAIQERIWKTYGPSLPPADGDSYSDKARDLREWLQKF